MSARAALKLVPTTRFFREEVHSWSQDGARDGHSLHFAVPFPDAFQPDLVGFFVNRYSNKGGVVLDPFCGAGTTALESAIRGRIAVAADSHPLFVRLAKAKLAPADITEITLALQRVNFRRPIDLKLYGELFSPFYDVETFREIVNLRSFLQQNNDKISSFIELVATSLLHGHSAGYFSVYSYPQVALSPIEQERLNFKRAQAPDYRAVAPRILRRAASILRDGISSTLRMGGLLANRDDRVKTPLLHQAIRSDARNLAAVGSGSVDLIVTAPPVPGGRVLAQELWLKLWFTGIISTEQLYAVFGQSSEGNSNIWSDKVGSSFAANEIEPWLEFINETLFEMARVAAPRSRMVIDLPEVRSRVATRLGLEGLVIDLVNEQLSRYWEAEGVYSYSRRSVKLGLAESRTPNHSNSAVLAADRNHVLVLRRR